MKKAVVLLFSFLLASWAQSATYYVDCAASGDSGAGTSTTTAWRTINRVNISSFSPGDSILFKRGCTWLEQLKAPSSGAAGNPITFGAYGSGAKPIIRGIVVNARAYINFNALQVDDAPGDAIDVYGQSSTLTFDSVDVHRAFKAGFHCRNAGQAIQNVTFANGEISYCSGNGLSIADDTTGTVIRGNTVHHNCRLNYPADAGAVSPDHEFTAGVKVTGTCPNSLIERNLVYSNGKGVASFAGSGIWLDGPVSGAIIRYNNIYQNDGNGIRLEEGATNSEVYYNVVHDQRMNEIQLTNHSGPSNNNKIYNNVAYSSGTYKTSGIAVGGSAGINDAKVYNNISVGHTVFELDVTPTADNSGGGHGNVYEYNCFGPQSGNFIHYGPGWPDPGSGNADFSTYDAWEAAYGGRTYSVEADPKLTNPATGDFTLQAASPCIDAGADLGPSYSAALMPNSSWPSNVLTGNQYTAGQWWEIGAYLFPGATPPPGGLTPSFTFSPKTPTQGQIVQFTDRSNGASAWNWDFGDGTRSTLGNPAHTYAAGGIYTVVLWVSNGVNWAKAKQTITVTGAARVRRHLPKR
jgi:PKD repeat protein